MDESHEIGQDSRGGRRKNLFHTIQYNKIPYNAHKIRQKIFKKKFAVLTLTVTK